MANHMTVNGGGRGFPWRILGWSLPAVLLTLPLIAGAPWTLSDYIVMGVLFGIAGLLIELAVKASAGSMAYRLGSGVAVLAAFLLIWVNGAVGFLGNEDNPANLMFGGVIMVAVLGSVLAGFRAGGMALAMFAAAAAQVMAGALGLAAGWASPGFAGIYEVVMGGSVFGCLWLLAAGLFRKAHQESGAP